MRGAISPWSQLGTLACAVHHFQQELLIGEVFQVCPSTQRTNQRTRRSKSFRELPGPRFGGGLLTQAPSRRLACQISSRTSSPFSTPRSSGRPPSSATCRAK